MMTICIECGKLILMNSLGVWVHRETSMSKCLAETVASPEITAKPTYDRVPWIDQRFGGAAVWSVKTPDAILTLADAINHKDFMGYVWDDELRLNHTAWQDGQLVRCDAVRFSGEG